LRSHTAATAVAVVRPLDIEARAKAADVGEEEEEILQCEDECSWILNGTNFVQQTHMHAARAQ
jgi:hypothetical protein